MNQTTRFRFAVPPARNEVAEQKNRRKFVKMSLICFGIWFFCLLLRVPGWIEAIFRQFGMMLFIMGGVGSTATLLKERARWGAVDLDEQELAVNTLNNPKRKIALKQVQSWKIQGKYLIIRWINQRSSWFKNRTIIVPFRDLETPEEFLTAFENNVAAAKSQGALL